MKKHKKLVFLIFISSLFIISTEVYSSMFGDILVKVYSEGKLVSTYKGKSGGRLVGSCYIFESASELNKKTITVCGTFTVEEKK